MFLFILSAYLYFYVIYMTLLKITFSDGGILSKYFILIVIIIFVKPTKRHWVWVWKEGDNNNHGNMLNFNSHSFYQGTLAQKDPKDHRDPKVCTGNWLVKFKTMKFIITTIHDLLLLFFLHRTSGRERPGWSEWGERWFVFYLCILIQ